MLTRITAACTCFFIAPSASFAEVELSFYGGAQSAQPSGVTVHGDTVIPDADYDITWIGKSFDFPIYAGVRVTYWLTDTFGFGLDYSHNKTEPNEATLPAGYDALEFTDGLNTWTINAYRRWPNAMAGMTPYVGAGLGVSAPGVEVRYGTSDTYEYQITGPAAQWLGGLTYPIDDQWSVFGEYKGTYTQNNVELKTGGSLKSDVFTYAVNVGVSYSFDK